MKPQALATPLTDDEYATLADLLDESSPFDVDGLLGVLHAAAVAPSLVPPSRWLSSRGGGAALAAPEASARSSLTNAQLPAAHRETRVDAVLQYEHGCE